MLTAVEPKTVREILLAGFTLAKFDALMLDLGRPREESGLGDDYRDILIKASL